MEADNKQNEIKPIVNKAELPHSVVVETLAGDMADVIGSGEGTSVKDIIHIEEEHEAEKRNLSPQSKKNRIFMLSGFFLLALAIATFSFLLLKNKNNTIAIQKQFIPIIFTDQAVSLEISGLKKDEITQAVLSEVNSTTVKAGGVEGIYLTENKQIIGLRRFITLIKSNFVPDSNSLLVSDSFLTGVVKNPTGASSTSGTGFFILLKVRSTADIFDSLRAWEPNILNDLHGFFGINISSDTNYLFTKDFTDGLVENKNARILYDKDGNVVVMYIFADNNSIIITDSLNAAHEVMQRLVSNQIKQ